MVLELALQGKAGCHRSQGANRAAKKATGAVLPASRLAVSSGSVDGAAALGVLLCMWLGRSDGIAGLDRRLSERMIKRSSALLTGYLCQEHRLLPWRSVRQNLAMVGASNDEIGRLLAQIGLAEVASASRISAALRAPSV